MTTFALVHGAWHGAWCWTHLQPELELRGHRVVAVELPSDDADESFSSYADVVVSAIEDEDEDLVLVGHSLAGLTIPIVAAKRPIRRMVFLCALIAAPGKSLLEQLASEPGMLHANYGAGLGEADEQGRRGWVDFELARETLFGDCEESQAQWAFDHLRPQALSAYGESCPLEDLPDIERTYVACSDDRIVTNDWSLRAARERLGVEPTWLPGSHSPFLSRPSELAQVLDRER